MTSSLLLVDGARMGSIPITDSSIVRGDGCFEALRVYSGRAFRVEAHLDRLERSAAAMGLGSPDRGQVGLWVQSVSSDLGEGVVRVILTRGGAVTGADEAGRCLVIGHPLPPPLAAVSLLPVAAPWHPSGREWELAGAKTTSYAANMAASRRAEAGGHDDALLVNDTGVVLEGPTFSVAWVRAGRLQTPSLDLGILDSITRRAVLEVTADIPVDEVVTPVTALAEVDEVFVMSTVKEVTPVRRIGDQRFETGPVTELARQRLAELVEAELGSH